LLLKTGTPAKSRKLSKVWYIENKWSCDSCGSSEQLGRHLECTNCGAPKKKDVIDRIGDPDTETPIIDLARVREAKAGANWICEYCGKQERTLHGKCRYCAGEKEIEAETVNSSQRRTGGLRYTPKETLEEQPESVAARIPSVKPRRWWHRRKNQAAAVLIAAVTVMVTWLGYWLFVPMEVDAKVTQVSWEYTKHLKQRETHHGSDWEDSRPSSHFNDQCETRQRGTENCHPYNCNPRQQSSSCRPHECNCSNVCTDQGNGYSSCTQSCSTCYDTCYETVYDTCYEQCPVYDEWCEYDYYTWPIIQTEVSSGVNNHDMKWPILETSQEHQKIESISKYGVKFQDTEDSGEKWDHSPETADEFITYLTGDYWKIKVNRAGMVKPMHKIRVEE